MKSMRDTRKSIPLMLVGIFLLVALMMIGSVQAVRAETVSNPSADEDNPIAITNDTYTYSGDNYSYHYYKYTASADSTVTIKRLEGNATSIYYRFGTQSSYESTGIYTDGYIELAATAGEEIYIRAYTGYGGGTYSFSVSAVDYKWGTITTSMSSAQAGKDNQAFTFKLTGADDDVTVQGWTLKGSSSDRGNCSVKNGQTGTGYLRTTATGYSTLTYTVYSSSLGYYDNSHSDDRFSKTITVKPSAISNVTLSAFSVGYNSAKIQVSSLGIGQASLNGSKVHLQRNKSGTWTTVKDFSTGTKTLKITGLKPKSTYQYRFIGYVPASGGNAELTGAPSKTFTIKTGVKTAPSVKSISTSGAKTSHVKRVYHPGHWSGSHWFKGYYTGGYDMTTFKVKVTLNKKIAGTAGLKISDKYVKGTGTTFTASISMKGKHKGKYRKFTISSYRDSTYGGTSKSVTKSAKIN